MTKNVKLVLQLDGSADAGEREEAALSLLEELRDSGPRFEVLRQPSTHGGSKDAGQLVSMTGQIVVALASGGALVAFINAVQAYLLRNGGKEAVVEIGGDKLVLKGATNDQIEALIKSFASRHQS